MSSGIYTIRPRDPLFARSASPFTADPGAQATTLDWPLPQTIAGALRTHIGEARRIDWSDEIERKQINSIAVHGGFLIERGVDDAGWMPFFPAPHDAHIFHDETTGNPGIHAVRPKPLNSGEGVNFPRNNGLTLEPLNIEHDEKPLPGYDLWSLNDINTWLLDLEQPAPPARHRGRLAQETRMHVTVESTTGTAKEGHLFATSGIAFSPTTFKTPEREMARQAMLCQITTPDDIGPLETPSYFTLGGEQRQARLGPKPALSVNPWDVPKAIVEALAGQTTFRLQLVTPALFRTGWYPGWISQAHRDRFPDVVKGLNCSLESAIVGRRVPVSGWNLRQICERPLRYAAPAGSVYFLSVPAPLTIDQIKALWLAPISDGRFDREDGYGLAIPGVWNRKG